MPSAALRSWFTVRAAALDEMKKAHRFVHGSGRGRRQATQQINQAYALLLSAQFQGFCRDLHTESADHLVLPASSPDLRALYLTNILHGHRLDTGNPNPGNLQVDFRRLDLPFWNAVDADHSQNPQRRALLEELNRWRNAIAHHEFASDMLDGGRPRLRLSMVEAWRRACDGLARSFDRVLRVHVQTRTGTAPW